MLLLNLFENLDDDLRLTIVHSERFNMYYSPFKKVLIAVKTITMSWLRLPQWTLAHPPPPAPLPYNRSAPFLKLQIS